MNTDNPPPPTLNPTNHRIEVGQEYAACASRPDDKPRIRVKGAPTPTGRWGVPNVAVVSLADDGRELRSRTIPVRLLHATATRPGGQRRRTGYYLVRNADGTPAAPGGAR